MATASPNGPYWSVTRYEDVRSVEIDHQTYSSEDNVTIVDQPADFQAPMFIAMDPPAHDAQRRVVQPAVAPPANDLISMLAHAPETADMRDRPMELLGNMILLIVGGNDTTRNSISGGVLALHKHPQEFDKLRANHDLVPNLVDEIIRWQTPLAHMRRTATCDTELGGKHLRAGDKVVLWYVSANRDEEVFPDGDALIIDRPNAGQHLSYGFGVHRCMGAHLADMQLRVLWEEILLRFDRVEVVGPPRRVRSNFVRGYTHLPVQVFPG